MGVESTYIKEHFELDEKAKRREIIVDAMDLFDEVPSAYLLLLQGWPTISGALRETAQQEAAALMGEAAAHLRVRLIHVLLGCRSTAVDSKSRRAPTKDVPPPHFKNDFGHLLLFSWVFRAPPPRPLKPKKMIAS